MHTLTKNKKFLCLLLVALMAVLTACSSADDPVEPADPDVELLDEDMEGPEATDIETNDLTVVNTMLNSFSTKQFAAEKVASEDLALIVQTGIQAASARNLQPWHFTVVTDYEIASQFAQVEEGMAAIVISGLREEMEGVNVDFDCGLATGNMYNAAQSLGLGAHIYTSPVSRINEGLLEVLEVPEGYEAVSVMTVGHMADREDAISGATTRNDFDEMVTFLE